MQLMQTPTSWHVVLLSGICTLLVATLALAQGPSDDADAAARPSHFSLYDRTHGEVLAPIGHGSTLSVARADGRQADAVLLELPADASGPVELYVDQDYRGELAGPPYVIPLSDLPPTGAVTLLAIPDVGYPAEVRFTLD